MNNPITKLDNPAWHSLNETHKPFAFGNDELKLYAFDICPFGGFSSAKNAAALFDEFIKTAEPFFIIGELPQNLPNIDILLKMDCLQMVVKEVADIEYTDEIVLLTEEHNDELVDLVTLVQPGYFRKKTRLTGDYFGIFKNGKLVSVTGERMRMYGFTELSAVVTHPEHVGKGYAKQLVAHVTNKNFAANVQPYLHVAAGNTNAIKLYEKLGYEIRMEIVFWKIAKRIMN